MELNNISYSVLKVELVYRRSSGYFYYIFLIGVCLVYGDGVVDLRVWVYWDNFLEVGT